MNFLEALNFCKETGKSVTKSRYSLESQNSVQWYFYKGKLVCQNYGNKPKCVSISEAYWDDNYIEYIGCYEQWYKTYQKDVERYQELKDELEPMLSKMEEYKRLQRKLEGLEL